MSAYVMDWSDVQLPLFDPVHLGNTTFVVNGPTYQVKGVELQVVGRVTPRAYPAGVSFPTTSPSRRMRLA